MEINYQTILIILLLFLIFNKNSNCENFAHCSSHSSKNKKYISKLNKVKEIKNFNPPKNILYINTLPEPYYTCNLTGYNNKAVNTVNKPKDIQDSENCALYCAHKDCGSAMNYYKRNKDLIHKKCKNVHYLKGGIKDLLKDNRFQMSDKKNCNTKFT